MEQKRKQLKFSSIAVLALAAFSLLQIVFELIFNKLSYTTVSDGASENVVLITKVFFFLISLLITLPNIYVGIKGLKISKNPNSSQSHIVWAIILLGIASLALIVHGISFIKSGFVYENISAFLSIAVEVTVFVEYIICAIAVRKSVT